MKRKPEISVIVPSMNEEKYIAELFRGLRAQSFRDFETIVVDADSADGTRSIARRNSARVVIERRRGIGRARNTGAGLARGSILVFLDADTRPCRNLLKAYHSAFREAGIIAATGPLLPLEKVGMSLRIGYRLESVYLVRSSVAVGRPKIVGSNFAVRKDAFERAGGFDTRYATYEDWDLSTRLGKVGRAKFVDAAVVYASARRLNEWGMLGYFIYHTDNMARSIILKRPKEEYEPIR